jgi:hypothetical protein
MAAIPAERCVSVAVQYEVDGNRLSTVLHYGANASLSDAAMEEFRLKWETDILPTWLLACCTAVTVEQLYFTGVAPNTLLPKSSQLTGEVGAISGDPAPSNVAAVLQFRQTEVSGRHNGRMFFGGMADTAFDAGGILSTAFFTGPLQDLADLLILPITIPLGTIFKLVVLKRFEANAPVTPVGYNVLTIVPQRNPGTMRRRTTEWRGFI